MADLNYKPDHQHPPLYLIFLHLLISHLTCVYVLCIESKRMYAEHTSPAPYFGGNIVTSIQLGATLAQSKSKQKLETDFQQTFIYNSLTQGLALFP